MRVYAECLLIDTVCAEPEEISTLWYLWYVASSLTGGCNRLSGHSFFSLFRAMRVYAECLLIDSVCAEPGEISLLWYLWYVASSGGCDTGSSYFAEQCECMLSVC